MDRDSRSAGAASAERRDSDDRDTLGACRKFPRPIAKPRLDSYDDKSKGTDSSMDLNEKMEEQSLASEPWGSGREDLWTKNPAADAPIWTEEERKHFYAEQDRKLRKLWIECPEPAARDTVTWTPGIFDPHKMPVAYYLDPTGYSQMMTLKRRTTSHWRQACPATFSAAEILFKSIPNRIVWGRQNSNSQWSTYTAGKWPDQKFTRTDARAGKKRGRWPDPSMAMIDILNALGNPARFAVGNTDTRIKAENWGEEAAWDFERIPVTCVRHLRLDVDMDADYAAFNQDAVVKELQRERAILAGLGYSAHFCRTGNRGHQIIIPAPALDRGVASLLMLMIRVVLAPAGPAKRRVVIDKSNLDSLLRLPLSRHALSESVAWMIDAETGQNLAVGLQAGAVREAWEYSGSGCELVETDADMLGLALDDMLYDRDRDITEGVPHDKRFALLADVFASLPATALIQAFRATCDRWCISLPRLASVQVAPGTGMKDLPETAPERAGSEAADDLRKERKDTSTPLVQAGKGWARSVIETGFRPGEFWEWAHASGKNAIGAAILYCDGNLERAERLLLEITDKVPGSGKDKEDRRRWIIWAVPRNNIEIRAVSPVRRDHLEVLGSVLPSETNCAQWVVDELVRRLRMSGRTRRVFSVGALVTLKHLVELIQLEARNCQPNVLRLSTRTLDAAIRERWPADATSHRDVSRQLKWVVAGTDCLFCVLERVDVCRNAYEASEYILAAEFVAFLTLE
jgi:hypothetical protein